ncbi:VanZ family protein [Microbacterium sp. RD1]|uniref:VanZ family protein n=1 Tax=Microbacterium sp. RD1 TaxID=3457313 RepID=UPI003FA5EC7C
MLWIARGLLAAAALLLVAALTLAPQPVVGPLRGAFLGWADAVQLPLLAGSGYPVTERLLNTALFVPLGAALAAVLPRRGWPWALLLSVVASFAVETAQSSIPGRIPDGADVLWNGVGGALGAMAIATARGCVAGFRQRGSVTRT